MSSPPHAHHVSGIAAAVLLRENLGDVLRSICGPSGVGCRKRRNNEDRRRADRDAQTQTILMEIWKEMAAGCGSGKEDVLMAASDDDPILWR